MNNKEQKAFDEWWSGVVKWAMPDERATAELSFEAGIKYCKDNKGTEEQKQSARNIINFLNEKTKKHFPCNSTNLKIVIARLNEGFTEGQIRQVIVKIGRDWNGNPEMAKYMRPKTLFGQTNFSNYVGEL